MVTTVQVVWKEVDDPSTQEESNRRIPAAEQQQDDILPEIGQPQTRGHHTRRQQGQLRRADRHQGKDRRLFTRPREKRQTTNMFLLCAEGLQPQQLNRQLADMRWLSTHMCLRIEASVPRLVVLRLLVRQQRVSPLAIPRIAKKLWDCNNSNEIKEKWEKNAVSFTIV